MRFLAFILLFVCPLFCISQQSDKFSDKNNIVVLKDTNKVLAKGGPPPGVMVPPNDNCTSATPLTATGVPVLCLSNATANTVVSDPMPSCFAYNVFSVWYSYTPATAGSLSLTIAGKTQKGSGIAIYSGGCGTFTSANELGCGQVSNFPVIVGTASATASCLTAGTTYYILVESATAGSYSITTTYSNTAAPGPANNCCTNAIDISTSLNSTPIVGTTSLATNDAPFVGSCNTAYNNVWYSFIAQGPNLEVTITGTATPQFLVLGAAGTATDVCTSTGVSSILCGTAGSTNNVTSLADSLTRGNTYYISVVNTNTVGAGSFTLNVNNPVPYPAGTDCATATMLCGSHTATGGNTNLWGYQDLTASTGDCFGGANTEIHSAWYYISILTGGTLNMNIASSTAYNYDFSIWKSTTTNICDNLNSGSLVSCNSYTPSTTTGGLSAAGTTTFTSTGPSSFNSTLNTTTNDVYAILVNSPAIAGTYTINITGTSILSCTVPIILPIELTNFTATQNGHEVDLKWITASEKNNNYFTIERSADGKTFEEFKKVKSASESGNSTGNLQYILTDYAPLAGVSYYRLSQTDLNGKTNKLTIVSVTNKENDGAFTIAPNPTTGLLNVSYICQANTTGLLKLFDDKGNLVLEKNILCTNGANKTQLDLQEKPSGIYLVTFTTNTSFYCAKLVKN